MNYIEAIQNQIDATSPILERIVCLCPVPERGSLNTGGKVCGKKRYDRVTVGLIEEDINHWQHKTRAVLAACFSDDSEYKYAFERTIVERRLHYDAKKELEHEVKEGRNVLSAIIDEVSLKMKLQPEAVGKAVGAKHPIVFISHASEDIDIIREFIDQILKNGLGLLDENIVCTSLEWTTVALGDNIPAYIHNNIEQSSVVLSMVSQAYKKSEPCQNEVGAAWALKRKPISIILPDADFSELGWLVNLDKAGKIDNADFLNHLQVDLCNHLGIQPKTALHWTPCVTKFLEDIKKLVPLSKTDDNLKAKQTQPQKVETVEQKHDKDLFMAFDKDFSEEEISYTLYSIQHTTHFSDFDLTTWYKIIHWFELTSNTFITNEVQNTANQLCDSLKKLIAFIGKANYSPDRISWCMDDDRNVTPEKWREIHEAKIYSWEPEIHDKDFYHEREKIVLNEIPGIVENIENAYKAFRMCIKKYLFI